MSEECYVYLGSLICLVIILCTFKYGRLFGLINLLLYFIYSIVLYYNLLFNSEGGSSLLWLFYLIFLSILQVIIAGVYLVIQLIKSCKKRTNH